MSITQRLIGLASVFVLAAVLAGCAGGIRFESQPNDAYSCVAASNFSKCRIEREKNKHIAHGPRRATLDPSSPIRN